MERIYLFIAIASIALISLGGAFHTSFAEKYNIIEVMYSQTCAKLVASHSNSDCPPLSKLIPFDTSNQHISGQFLIIGDHYIRTHPQMKDHYKWYSTTMNKSAVCVECFLPLGSPDLFKTIIIEPGNFTFISKYDTMVNNTLKSYHTRYLAGCNTANIAFTPTLLNDTIHYMGNNCIGSATSYNNTSIKVIKPTMKLDYNNYYYIHKAWLDSIKQNHGYGDCIRKHCKLPSEGKKW